MAKLPTTITWVVAGSSLVTPPVVARQASHELLRVVHFNIVEKLRGALTAQSRGDSSVVSDDDGRIAHEVIETCGWFCHGFRLIGAGRACN